MGSYRFAGVLTIAGSDSGAGAGIQADLKTISALGCYASTAITAVTAQNTLGVQAIHWMPAKIVIAQVISVLGDLKPAVIKIGMIGQPSLIQAIVEILSAYASIPVIFDPVMIASSGKHLMVAEAVQVIKDSLIPMVALLTPNLDEAALLTGLPVTNLQEMETAAAAILALGCKAVLIKGGHLNGTELFDIYMDAAGGHEVIHSTRIVSSNTHGTGCTLSAAIAAYLSLGYTMLHAITCAKHYVHQAILHGAEVQTGSGQGPLNHFFDPQKMMIVSL